jgi:hypothetical protein
MTINDKPRQSMTIRVEKYNSEVDYEYYLAVS